MNKYLFLIIWSLISPSCAGLIAHFLRIHLPAWNPGYKDIRISIAIYLAYWLPLGFLQAGVLFWKLRDRKFAYKWFLRTSITGFLVMLSYDLVITSMQAGDRVVVVLAFFLPFLVLAGGLILGSVQLSLINYHRYDITSNKLKILWIIINLFSWIIGFTGVIFPDERNLFILCIAAGTTLKGLFINKYLKV